MMKYVFGFLLFLFCSPLFCQVTLTGTVLDADDGSPLPYVNIGVIGKNIGTVSNLQGQFEIDVSKAGEGDTIRLSSIGYSNLELKVAAFKQVLEKNNNISLATTAIKLQEVVVSGNDLKEKVIGNKTTSKNLTAKFSTDELGNEVGVVMKIKGRPTYIKDFNCFIVKNEYGLLKFRLNIYEMEKGMPGKNILTENIFVETEITEGLLTVDLSSYNLWVEKDFLVSLEWIEDLGKDGLSFSARLLGAPMIERKTSQGNWNKISFASLGFNVTVRY